MVFSTYDSDDDLALELGRLIKSISDQSETFTIGLSGGSCEKYLNLALPKNQHNLSKWRIFFCDERLVPHSDSESTYGLYNKGLFKDKNFSTDQIFPVNTSLPPSEAASDYERQLKSVFPDCDYPNFDLLLLGMGPDGHTCSLFPGHSTLKSTKWIVPELNSPKPPPKRVTMTIPVLNNAKNVVFVSTGAGKAEILRRIFIEKDQTLPAAMVQPRSGNLHWLLDAAAANKL